MVSDKHYPYDIAISYAGEDRDTALALAESLRSQGVSVFYDRYEKATLWGRNLYNYLSDLYQNQAHYCLMLLSQHYAQKVWTTHEREAAQNRAVSENEEYILPIRLDKTDIPGHLKTLVYLDWHEETVETVTQAILEKLGRKTETFPPPRPQPPLSPPRVQGTPTSQKTKEKWLEEGNKLRDLKQYEQALAAYEQAIQLDPNFAFACYGKGNVLYDLKRYEQALVSYEQAIRLNPNYALAYYGKGVALDELKRYEQALVALNQVIQLDPNFAFAYNSKGNVLRDLKRYEQALASYDQAIQLDPNYAFAYNGKGNVLRDLKRYEQALASYDQAIQLDPNYALAYNNKGNVFDDLKRYEEAITAYNQAIRLDPNDALTYNNKGKTLQRMNRSYDAQIAFSKAKQLGFSN